VELVSDLQAQLEKLNRARAMGVRQISYMTNGATRTVEYKSDMEMDAAQTDLRRRIAELQGLTSRTVRVASSKGFCEENER
jgi:hypothetical protein